MGPRFSTAILILGTILSLTAMKASGKMKVGKDGGFTGIMVSIAEGVEDDPDLIESLQKMFTEGSEALYTATGQRLYFADVTFILPRNWTSHNTTVPDVCSPGARILVDAVEGVAGPYVKQGGTCGEPGKYMLIPEEYVKDTEEEREKRFGSTGKTLAHEFAHLRWGVFDEYPRSSAGKQYYLDSKNRPQPVTCAAGIGGQWVTPGSKGMTCDPTKGDPTKEEKCVFRPDNEGSEQGEYASVMGYHFLDQVSQFCDESEDTPEHQQHNGAAPTEQNQRCDGRSVMQVIREFHGEDLPNDMQVFSALKGQSAASLNTDDTDSEESEESPSEPPSTTFHIAKEKEESGKYIFVIEPIWDVDRRKANMTEKILAAFRQFLHDLPDPQCTMIELQELTCDNYRVKTNASVYATQEAQEQLLGNISEIFDNHWKTHDGLCIASNGRASSGFDDSITNAIKNVPNSSNVILVSYGGRPVEVECSGGADRRFGEAIHPADSSFSLTFVQLGTYRPDYTYECVSIISNEVNRTGGQHIVIGDPPKEFHFTVPAKQHGIKIPETLTLFSKSEKNSNNMIQDTFLVESGLQSGVLTFTGEAFYEENITITDPSNNPVAGNLTCSEDATCRIELPGELEAGTWSYSLTSVTEDFTVTFSASPRPGYIPINLSAYLSVDNIDFSGDRDTRVLSISADVNKGYSAVIEANVVATVTQGATVVELPLLDNGQGADSRAGDGTYAAYFTQFEQDGDLEISASIDNSKEGAKIAAPGFSKAFDRNLFLIDIEVPDPELADPFTRYSPLNPVNVVNLPPNGTDLYPPARVTDLVVRDFEHKDRTIEVQFTASGDDLSHGKASRYEFRHAPSARILRSNFTHGTLIPTVDITPKPTGTTEHVRMNIPVEDEDQLSYAIALQVFDDANQFSEASNIAQFTFVAEKYISTVPPTTEKPTTEIPSTTTEKKFVDEFFLIGGICGAILGLVIVVIILLLCFCCGRNCRRKSESPTNDMIQIHMHPEPQGGAFPAAGPYPDPPPSYYSNSPSNKPAGLAMRSTVRRELEELEQLPDAPAPPPPRPRGRAAWRSIKGTISNSRVGQSVAGAINKASRFYNGHVSYRDHQNNHRRASIRMAIEDEVVSPPPPQLPGKQKNYNSPEAHPQMQPHWKKDSDEIDWFKQSGKYHNKIEPSFDNDITHPEMWKQSSGKYNQTIESAAQSELPPKSPVHVFPRSPGRTKQKDRAVTPKGTIDFVPNPTAFLQNSGTYDDVIPDMAYRQQAQQSRAPQDAGHWNRAYLPTPAQPRKGSESSEEYYSHACEPDATRVLDIRSDATYNDAMSVQPMSPGPHQLSPPGQHQLSPPGQHQFSPGVSPRYQGYSAQTSPRPPAQNPPLSPTPHYNTQLYPHRHDATTECDVYDDTVNPAPPPPPCPRRPYPQPPPQQQQQQQQSNRISTSSFYQEIEQEQEMQQQQQQRQPDPSFAQPTVFKNKAKRMGFNYMEPKI